MRQRADTAEMPQRPGAVAASDGAGTLCSACYRAALARHGKHGNNIQCRMARA